MGYLDLQPMAAEAVAGPAQVGGYGLRFDGVLAERRAELALDPQLKMSWALVQPLEVIVAMFEVHSPVRQRPSCSASMQAVTFTTPPPPRFS